MWCGVVVEWRRRVMSGETLKKKKSNKIFIIIIKFLTLNIRKDVFKFNNK